MNNKTEQIIEGVENSSVNCIGGCGSGLGFFVILAIVLLILIFGVLIYILIKSIKEEK